MDFRTYRVNPRDRAPLLDFIHQALLRSRCRILYSSTPDTAPFRVTFETAEGERIGIVAYAFLANNRATRNRPPDEHRFQIKYGSKPPGLQRLWQDPYGLYVTLFVGINPDTGFFVGADPVLHSPTKFFISLEFKQEQADSILRDAWHVWERDRRPQDEPVEILVGGTADSFLRYVCFERQALGEDQGHRQLLAERAVLHQPHVGDIGLPLGQPLEPATSTLHSLAREFAISEREVLDLIANARRLKMAVRGWVAEHHLVRSLRSVRGVTQCIGLDEEGAADVQLCFENGPPLRIECKNVLRNVAANGDIRLDFQRTRASKKDPCSRYYSERDFDVVAACLHAVTEQWEFRYALSRSLDPHPRCAGKLTSNVRLDERWRPDAALVLRAATGTAA
jgi:hypothetical protein